MKIKNKRENLNIFITHPRKSPSFSRNWTWEPTRRQEKKKKKNQYTAFVYIEPLPFSFPCLGFENLGAKYHMKMEREK